MVPDPTVEVAMGRGQASAMSRHSYGVPGLLDIIVGYDCNVACSYCTITPAMRERALEGSTIAGHLRRGRAQGFDDVSFTGGEPTIRPDLLPLLRRARSLGYARRKVQSNGLLLGVGDNAARLLEAGANVVHISIHTHDEAAYEAMVQRAGTHALMQAALERLVAHGVELVADVIVERETLPRVPEAIAWLIERGVKAADLWFVSLTDRNAARPESLPPMSALAPMLDRARPIAEEAGFRLRSLHVPRCLLGAHADLAFDVTAQRVRVISPDAAFDLADSAITPREHVPACEGCEHRERCPGLRPDYLREYGDVEVAAARGVEPSRHGRRTPSLPVLG